MHFNVPQFVDIEDRIAFQLTAKQLGWFALGGVILYFIWQFVEPIFFYIWVAIIGLMATAFAFYKPQGIPLHKYLAIAFLYLMKPKVLVWERKARARERSNKKSPKKEEHKVDLYAKEDKLKKAADLARVLDDNSKI